METKRPLLAFFGHHKCATKFVLAIVKQICTDCGLRLLTVSSAQEFEHRNLQCHADFLAYTNAQWPYVAGLKDFRAFHVIRDPRDVLVSAYFSHLHSHETRNWPSLPAHREKLKILPKPEGLMLELDFCQRVFKAIQDWPYNDERILELRFEKLVAEPYQTFLNIFEHLGLLKADLNMGSRLLFQLRAAINQSCHSDGRPFGLRLPNPYVPPQRVLSRVYENRFEKRAGGRSRGDEDVRHHYRKGIPGDWRNHLSIDLVLEFNRRYPGLLQKTGYDEPVSAAA